MQVKGTSIKTTRDFVKAKFPNRYEEWLKTLSKDSQKIYSDTLKVTDWYDLKTAYTEPMDKIVDLFYNKNAQKGGEEMGVYSAEIGLNGIYKVFLLVASPQYLMKRGTRTMETFYMPSEIEVSEKGNNMAIIKIKKFDGISKALEYRIAGWCARALDLCKCKNRSYRIISHLSAGQDSTTIEFKWDS